MCTICAAFRPYTDSCDYVRIAAAAATRETGDAADTSGTEYQVGIGGLFSGSIGEAGDRDWIRVELVQGQTYEFDLTGASSGGGTLADPVLTLYAGDGQFLTGNDDGGTGSDARILYKAETSGTFYLMSHGHMDATGDYSLSVSTSETDLPGSGAVIGSLQAMASYLTDGYWQDSGRTAHSFDTSAGNRITVNLDGLSDEGKAAARMAMQAWQSVADIVFEETAGTAQITIDDNAEGAYSSYASSGGTTQWAQVNVGTDWIAEDGGRLGTYGFHTYLHEIGHALGLGHQGSYDGAARYGTDNNFVNDSWQMSVMSYFSQTENTALTGSYGEAITPMAADIVAVQSLYGAAGAGSLTAGATVYGLGHSLGNSWLGRVFNALTGDGAEGTVQPGTDFIATIFDAGGRDLLDFSFDGRDQKVSLKGGAALDLLGEVGNFQIAHGTRIEDFAAGRGDDRVRGNAADNTIDGNAGDDRLLGRGGDDRLTGQDGRDRLLGNGGDDRLTGGAGCDRLIGGKGDDVMTGGGGRDTFVYSGGQDEIRDFRGDRLRIDKALLDEAELGAAMLRDLATVVDGDTIIEFGADDVLILRGFDDPDSLLDSTDLV